MGNLAVTLEGHAVIRVGDLCGRSVSTVAPDDAISTAVTLMRREHIGDVVVVVPVDGGARPVGILTDRDVVVELMAPGIDARQVAVGDCMSEAIVTAREDEDLLVALQRMAAAGTRRLPIVDARGCLSGILTVDDVLSFLGKAAAAIAEIIAEGRSRESIRRR